MVWWKRCGREVRHRGWRAEIALAFAVFAAGCTSSTPPSAPPGPPSPSFRDRFTNMLGGRTAANPPPAEAGALDPTEDCPTVDVRRGTSTLVISAPGVEANATNVRYQVTIVRTARECVVRGPNLTMKVGVEGRVILGPLGAPGQIDVPLRLALVREGVEPRTIWTKFYRVPVVIPPAQPNVNFTQVEEDLTFPIPKRSDLDAYVVYVGFDQLALQSPPATAKKKKVKARPPR